MQVQTLAQQVVCLQKCSFPSQQVPQVMLLHIPFFVALEQHRVFPQKHPFLREYRLEHTTILPQAFLLFQQANSAHTVFFLGSQDFIIPHERLEENILVFVHLFFLLHE